MNINSRRKSRRQTDLCFFLGMSAYRSLIRLIGLVSFSISTHISRSASLSVCRPLLIFFNICPYAIALVSMSKCLCLFLHVCVGLCVNSFCSSVCVSVCLSVYICGCLCLCMSVYMSIYICLCMHLFLCLFLCLSVFIYLHLSL